MPIYEYKCELCDHHFETLQKISDEPLKTCPACRSDNLTKLISTGVFNLKGDGFHKPGMS